MTYIYIPMKEQQVGKQCTAKDSFRDGSVCPV